MANRMEEFQDFCRRYFNPLVRTFYDDVVEDLDFDSSRTNERATIRYLCTHWDDDTLLLTLARMFVWKFFAEGLFEEQIYGIPVTEFHRDVTLQPQLTVFFMERGYDAATEDRVPVRKRLSVRLNEEITTDSEVDLLANRVRQELATPIFRWQTGSEYFTYRDKARGYIFQIFALNETEARDVVNKMIDLDQGGTPDFTEYLRRHTDDKNYLTTEFEFVLGQSVRQPRRRPRATVEFAWAQLNIPKLPEPINLVDATGRKPNARLYV